MASDGIAPESFFAAQLSALRPAAGRGRDWLDDLRANAERKGLHALAAFAVGRTEQARFLGAVLSLSAYLRETFVSNPQFLDPMRSSGLAARLEALLADVAVADRAPQISESLLMQRLRRLKREIHGLIALGDLGGVFRKEESALWLTRLAEKALGAGVRFLMREGDKAGTISLQDDAHPEHDCGLIVLGMGKLGACELNYSSDIDLILLIDETSAAIKEPDACVATFSAIARRLARIMQERTPDGYVFRVDLRLRPDPGSTPLALPVNAAMRYYEARGQNWERAALIKARPVAGDIRAAETFLKKLAPFIWRRYLDYAAVADIHAIKQQIHLHRGYGAITVQGHDIKLGRGGIREIEFFVQTQQLIAGGRFAQLRGRRTVEVLATLCDLGWITPKVRDDLREKYVFLRDVEHRIQMLADEQTHILPPDDEGFLCVAQLMGYHKSENFARDILITLKTVGSYYAVLFEHEGESQAVKPRLVFTGEEDDPQTLTALSRLGFKRAADMSRIIRGWYVGRYRATQSAEARERLAELTPALLQAFGATRSADEVLIRFDRFLQGLPAGIQLFSLLHSNPALLNMLVMIMSAAPRLADIIMRKPHVFDGMLDPALFSELPTRDYLRERLFFFLWQTDAYEEILDRLRIFANEQRFLIGVRLLTGAIDGERAGRAFTDLADLMIATCLETVEKEFVRHYGHVAGGRIGILGMGKLGSRELTAGSDIDLILLYDHDSQAEMSDGPKPLYVSQYYARLTKRLVAALSAPTGEGVLYEVDLRLRPSGNKGPVAVLFSAFGKYQRNAAWEWEHMALTRARAVAGDMLFCRQLEQEVAHIIALPRTEKDVATAVCDMRALLEKEKPAKSIWDLKTMPGGIIDLEFMAQYAVLTGKAEYAAGNATGDILMHLPKSAVAAVDGVDLHYACRLYTNLNQLMWLCLNEVLDQDDMPPGLSGLLRRVCGEPDMERIANLVTLTTKHVRKAFAQMIGAPQRISAA